MDATRFDGLTRLLAARSPRRLLLAGITSLGIGLAAGPPVAQAKKGKKPKKKKLKLNTFGCVNVGGKCRGNSANCCSGICEGKKPKKGKRDKSRCVAHDASTCVAGQFGDLCDGEDVLCTTTAGSKGSCATTTGNAGYCFNLVEVIEIGAPRCRRDADCQDLTPNAACVFCPDNETFCVTFDA